MSTTTAISTAWESESSRTCSGSSRTRRPDTGTWLLVNDGEGTRRDAYLWISAGTSIALVPIPDEKVE